MSDNRYFHFPDIREPQFVEITLDDLKTRGRDLVKDNGFVVCVQQPGENFRDVRAMELSDAGQWYMHEMTWRRDVTAIVGDDDRNSVAILEYIIRMFELQKKQALGRKSH